jgi:hypothetical protein
MARRSVTAKLLKLTSFPNLLLPKKSVNKYTQSDSKQPTYLQLSNKYSLDTCGLHSGSHIAAWLFAIQRYIPGAILLHGCLLYKGASTNSQTCPWVLMMIADCRRGCVFSLRIVHPAWPLHSPCLPLLWCPGFSWQSVQNLPLL